MLTTEQRKKKLEGLLERVQRNRVRFAPGAVEEVSAPPAPYSFSEPPSRDDHSEVLVFSPLPVVEMSPGDTVEDSPPTIDTDDMDFELDEQSGELVIDLNPDDQLFDDPLFDDQPSPELVVEADSDFDDEPEIEVSYGTEEALALQHELGLDPDAAEYELRPTPYPDMSSLEADIPSMDFDDDDLPAPMPLENDEDLPVSVSMEEPPEVAPSSFAALPARPGRAFRPFEPKEPARPADPPAPKLVLPMAPAATTPPESVPEATRTKLPARTFIDPEPPQMGLLREEAKDDEGFNLTEQTVIERTPETKADETVEELPETKADATVEELPETKADATVEALPETKADATVEALPEVIAPAVEAPAQDAPPTVDEILMVSEAPAQAVDVLADGLMEATEPDLLKVDSDTAEVLVPEIKRPTKPLESERYAASQPEADDVSEFVGEVPHARAATLGELLRNALAVGRKR